MADTLPRRVYRRLVDEAPFPLHPRVLSKATLTELSHVLENVVLDHDLDGAVFTGFQESGNWLQALDQYQRLVRPRARSVAVFAAGNLDTIDEDGIVRVQLADDDPLREEWFLVVLTEGFTAVLLGEDTQAEVATEADREFETVLGLTPPVVEHVGGFLRDEVALRDPATAARMDEALATWAPGPAHAGLQDLVLGQLVSVLEVGRARARDAARAMQRAAEDLREVDRSKNAFLSVVSHELRTPMTVVHGMAETLARLGPELPEARRQQAAEAVASHASRLSVLLTDLVDVDRMLRGQLAVAGELIDAAAVVRGAVPEGPPDSRVELDVPNELPVHLDAIQLERIVANLVSNAIKYAPVGPIRVTLLPTETGVRLVVDDEGPGIRPEERERVFLPFHRSDNDHPQPGTGIGLTLVAEFARLHGGEVHVEESPGGGARVVVELRSPEP